MTDFARGLNSGGLASWACSARLSVPSKCASASAPMPPAYRPRNNRRVSASHSWGFAIMVRFSLNIQEGIARHEHLAQVGPRSLRCIGLAGVTICLVVDESDGRAE